MAARNAERGATSMTCVQARPMRKTSAPGSVAGMGIKARQMAEGRWVNTIVCANSMGQSGVVEGCGIRKGGG